MFRERLSPASVAAVARLSETEQPETAIICEVAGQYVLARRPTQGRNTGRAAAAYEPPPLPEDGQLLAAVRGAYEKDGGEALEHAVKTNKWPGGRTVLLARRRSRQQAVGARRHSPKEPCSRPRMVLTGRLS